MREGKYQVIFVGSIKEDAACTNRLIWGLQNRFNLSAEVANKLLRSAPTVVKREISWSQALKYKRALEDIGAEVIVRGRGIIRKVVNGHLERQRKSPITSKLTPGELLELYYEEKKSLQDIAAQYGCTRQMIKKLMTKYGIQCRTRSEARVKAIEMGKFDQFSYDEIDETFFGKWNRAMAWVLGLLFTDGNMYDVPGKGPRVSISSIDLELLEKVRKFLNSTRPIVKRLQSYDNSKHIYYFEFFREKMRKDLHKLGLFQGKSRTMRFPKILPQYVRHFIRGCWDGDGSVYISGGKLGASFTCGSHSFISRMVQELYKAGIYRTVLRGLDHKTRKSLKYRYPYGKYPLAIHKIKGANAYEIKIRSKNALETLFRYLYDGVDEGKYAFRGTYLTRKYRTFAKGVSLTETRNRERDNNGQTT